MSKNISGLVKNSLKRNGASKAVRSSDLVANVITDMEGAAFVAACTLIDRGVAKGIDRAEMEAFCVEMGLYQAPVTTEARLSALEALVTRAQARYNF